MPKHSINDSAMKKAPMKILNLPFEATFRLQVRSSYIPLVRGEIKNEKCPMHAFSGKRS